jgi:hypothetical protein
MSLMYGQCYHVIRMQLRRGVQTTQSDFRKNTILGQLLIKYSGEIDRTGLKILENNNSYLRYKCKKLSFIGRTGLKYDRGTREYFKRCECNKGTFYTYVLQHFIYDRLIITGFNINLYKIIHWFNIS